MSWAKSVLPMFTGDSSEKLRIAPDQVQIDTTHFRPQAPPKSALSRTRLAVNGTAVIEDIKKDLLKQHRIQLDHRKFCRKLKLDMMLSKNLVRAPQCAADNLTKIMSRHIRHDGARFELRHVEQVRNKAIEPLGFVDNGCQQIGLLRFGELARK